MPARPHEASRLATISEKPHISLDAVTGTRDWVEDEPNSPLAALGIQLLRLKLVPRILIILSFIPAFWLFTIAQTHFGILSSRLWRACAVKTPSHPVHGLSIAYKLQDHIKQSLVDFAPWSPASDYVPVPSHCKINQINILERHASQYPDAGLEDSMRSAFDKLETALLRHPAGFEAVRNYSYSLGSLGDLLEHGELTEYGRREAFAIGTRRYLQYRDLFDSSKQPPFIRTTNNLPNLQSVEEWGRAVNEESDADIVSEAPTVLSSDDNADNPLADDSCPFLDFDRVQDMMDIWANRFTPVIAERLNKLSDSPRLFIGQDVLNLFLLCGFESAARGTESEICSLFSKEEFLDYVRFICFMINTHLGQAYWRNLEKFYLTGAGNFRFGRPQGIGWVVELLARLQEKPRQLVVKVGIETIPQIDLDSDFPLDRSIYLDSTSDTQIIAVLSAMGFWKDFNLDPRTRTANHPSYGKLVPFSGNVVIERMTCRNSPAAAFVRVLSNDKVLKLSEQQCPGYPSAQKDGLCPLATFVDGQDYAREAGNDDWLRCAGGAIYET